MHALIDKHLIIDQKQNIPFGKLHNYISGIDKLYKAMNFTQCCMGEAEQLSDKPIDGGTSYNDL